MEIKLVRFNRAIKLIEQYGLLKDKKYVKLYGPYGFIDYLNLQYNTLMELFQIREQAQEEMPAFRRSGCCSQENILKGLNPFSSAIALW